MEEDILKRIEEKVDLIYKIVYGKPATSMGGGEKKLDAFQSEASHPPSSAPPSDDHYKYVCDFCGEKKITDGIKQFCQENFKPDHKFHGKLICMSCQKKKN